MKIEIEKEDFVRLATYASCADLPKEENKCGMTLRKVMDSLDKEDANAIAGVAFLVWGAAMYILCQWLAS